MKNYSDNSVSRDDLTTVMSTTMQRSAELIDAVDQKQSTQIKQLRIWCACLTVAFAAQLAFIISLL